MTPEELFEKNTKLAHYVVHKRFKSEAMDEDMHQTALFGLWQACRTYDDKVCSFSTYASKCIYNALCRELRKRRPQEISLDAPVHANLEEITIAETIADRRQEIGDELFIMDQFTERQKTIAKLRIQGFTQMKVCQIMGLCEYTVVKELKRMRQLIDA